MELAKDLTRRSVLCGIALIAVGLLPEAAKAAVPAVGVKVKGKKLLLDLKANKVLAKVGGVVQIDFSDGSSSGTVDIPTNSAPITRRYRISAGVS